MVIDNSNKLDFFRDLCERAKSNRAMAYDDMDKAQKQYEGDNAIDGSGEAASYVRNITRELIESQIDTSVPVPKVTPRSQSEKGTRNAESAERLVKSLRDLLPFEMYNDRDERNTYIYGGSVWLVEWDESITTHYTSGDVRVSQIQPRDFFPQPNVMDVADMDYCILRYISTRDDLTRRYGVKDTSEAALDLDTTSSDDTDDTVTVYVCYYRDEADSICRYTWSGDLVLEDIDDYFARKTRVCRVCGRKERICTCDKPDVQLVSDEYEQLDHDISLTDGSVIPSMSPVINDDGTPKTVMRETVQTDGDGNIMLDARGEPMVVEAPQAVMAPTKIGYYKPKTLPIVIRRNISSERDILGISDCLAIRHQQQAINKLESRIMQKLMRAGVTPVIPEDAEISVSNQVFGQVIKLRPGERATDYGTVDTTPDISRDIAASERIYEQAKRILGITDSYQGQYDASAKSGVAKQVQVAQTSGRLESKRRMKQSAYADIDRIIFECYLAYADEPRPIAYRDRFGHIQNKQFNRYDFVEYDDQTGEWYYDDQYLFSVDTSSLATEDRDTLWQSTLTMLQTGAFGDPGMPETMAMYWSKMERLHYPYARENVEYFNQLVDRMQQAQISQSEGDTTNA